MSLRPLQPTPEHFLGAGRPYRRRRHYDGANSCLHSNAVPGFTNAKAVNLTGPQCINEKRWRYDDQPNISIRINAARGEPIAQLIVVTGERIHHRKGEWLRPA